MYFEDDKPKVKEKPFKASNLCLEAIIVSTGLVSKLSRVISSQNSKRTFLAIKCLR